MINWTQLLRPKDWDSIIAQKQTKSLLLSSLENDNLGQFIIFSGQSGTGKSCLAELVGAIIACENSKVTPCGHCKNCLALQHGDNTIVKKFNMATMIGKQDILTIISTIFDYPSIEGKAVFILEEVDALSEINQRPFLEPLQNIPEDITVIMCTAHYGNLIPELRNRAVLYRLETPNTEECINFIQNICRKMGATVPSYEVASLFSNLCNNVPRSIVSTLQMFANNELTAQTISDYFGVASVDLYISLMKNLSKQVNELDFIVYAQSIFNDAKKIIKGLDRFMVTLLLERSQSKPFKQYSPAQAQQLQELFKILTQEEVLILTEKVADMPKRAFVDDYSAVLFLIQLKLALINRDKNVLSDNKNVAMQTKLFAERQSQARIFNEERQARQQRSGLMSEAELRLRTFEEFEE